MQEPQLYSTKEAATELGISIARVKQLRETLGVGRVIGRTLIFTEADIERMRQRHDKPGPIPRTPKEGSE